MEIRDYADNPEVRETLDLIRQVSGVSDPQEVQRIFSMRLASTHVVAGYLAVSVRGLKPGEYKITRMMLDQDGLRRNRVDPWRDWNNLPTHRGGLIGEIIRTESPKVITGFADDSDPVLGDRLKPFKFMAAYPLFDEGRALNWSMFLRAEGPGPSDEQVDEMLMRGNMIGRITKNLVVAQEVAALNRRLAGQLDEIARLQRSLLPDRVPRLHGLEIATSYLTSNEAGGDYYDFLALPDDRSAVVIADVAGHGAGAATVMAMVRTLLHGRETVDMGPADMLAYLNARLSERSMEGRFVTAFIAEFDKRRRTVRYANAGHNRPMRHAGTGVVDTIDGAAGLPLGVIEEERYEEATIEVAPGHTMVLYTDGITEAKGPAPEREMFGEVRLVDTLRACTGAPACVIESVHEGLYAHTRELSRSDDQTIVAVRVAE
ncbi:MAG: PP2C family protein-serine/threonine phosphatase [Phycisphaerales bacterium]|nr:serine/threonine-protein phosphatase [Phycisphaerales bacterium]